MTKIARQHGIPKQVENTWRHSQCVWNFAKKIGKLAQKNGYKVDMKFLKRACFIHDLGRMQTGSKGSRELLDAVYHGYLGYKLSLKYGLPKKLAETCRRHLGGAGLSASVNKKFKMGRKSTFARTIEEKILGYADCRTFHNKIAPFSKAYQRFSKFPGQGPRLLALQKFIKKITYNKIR
ncbi:MAG: HDIG domain-containing metalloprotein [Patescibacteria group bacterium]